MTHLFEPFRLREVTLPNRIGVPPMCQYHAEDGCARPWHLVHYGGLAQGGAGLVIVEATAVLPEGRITAQDLGLWRDDQAGALAPMVAFMADQGTVPAVQLAHAGRKAGTAPPWMGRVGTLPLEDGGWQPVAPSALPFDGDHATPEALDRMSIERIVEAFATAARRALGAGFKAVEIHAAHGYLAHQFLSPLTNKREDGYGGDLMGRSRFLREVVEAVRGVLPSSLPLLVRLSATDWAENGGWDLEQTLELVRLLKPMGVDLVDMSSGGNLAGARIPLSPGYQVPFAARVRHETGMPTAAVGLISEPAQAEAILEEGQADLVLLGRELLRHPRWPLAAAAALGHPTPWPKAYARAASGTVPMR